MLIDALRRSSRGNDRPNFFGQDGIEVEACQNLIEAFNCDQRR
jgi:hypothetical protein